MHRRSLGLRQGVLAVFGPVLDCACRTAAMLQAKERLSPGIYLLCRYVFNSVSGCRHARIRLHQCQWVAGAKQEVLYTLNQ